MKKSCKNIKITKEYNSKINIKFLNTKIYDNENDNSIVGYLNIHNIKFLYMGDASINVEKEILEKYKLTNVDFLKVGHHGSDTSSGKEFIDEINPKYSIISVWKNNRYGHPKDKVLNNLSNSKTYRTDLNGTIAIKLNSNYKIKTYSP